jgi:hypothetical protein
VPKSFGAFWSNALILWDCHLSVFPLSLSI